MGKLLDFNKEDTLEQVAQRAYDAITQGQKIAVVIDFEDFIETGYWNCTVIDKQTMASHIQIDVIDQCMRATYALDKLED